MRTVQRDLTFSVAGQKFGFVDMTHSGLVETPFTQANLGPLGSYRVPATASVGWGFVTIILAAAILLVSATAIRRVRFSAFDPRRKFGIE